MPLPSNSPAGTRGSRGKPDHVQLVKSRRWPTSVGLMHKPMPLWPAATLTVLVACGGKPPANEPAPTHETASAPKPALQMKSELGSIDPGAVKRAFHALADPFTECQKAALDRVEMISGSVKIFVRISEAGGPKWAYLEESDLGDRATEKCLIDAVMGGRFPKPDGGEAEVHYGMELPLQSTRPPTDWNADKVDAAIARHADAIRRCKTTEGGALRATLYVGPGGKVLAAGVAGSGKDGDEEADCVVRVLEKMKGLPSPGGWPAKVSVSL
jgi:hypothetical protein